jgi:uncharacterized lipoprotein YddW (UPF0748 family)
MTTAAQCDAPPTDDELRGVWVTNVDSDVLDREANIEAAMEFLAAHNFNVVYPVVWNDAVTMYPSTVTDTLIGRPSDPQYEGRDPLAELVTAAHAEGLAVIPWFEFGFSSSYEADGGPILEKPPNWAARCTSCTTYPRATSSSGPHRNSPAPTGPTPFTKTRDHSGATV